VEPSRDQKKSNGSQNRKSQPKQLALSSDSTPNLATLLDSLREFNSETKDQLKDISLSMIDGLSINVKELWTQSTTTWPQIFDASTCWTVQSPTSADLICHTINKIVARKAAEKQAAKKTAKVDEYKHYLQVYSRGQVDSSVDPRLVLAQLYELNKFNLMAILGYQLKSLVPDSSLTTPEALTKFVEPFNEDNVQILLTPTYWVTDLHIGRKAPELEIPMLIRVVDRQLRWYFNNCRTLRKTLGSVPTNAQKFTTDGVRWGPQK